MPKLRTYQAQAVERILEKKRMLIGDGMGLGKCAEAISAKTKMEKRQGYDSKTLIISPTSVMEHWENEIKKWYKKGDQTKIAKIQTKTYDQDISNTPDSDFVIVGYPTLSNLGNIKTKMNALKDLQFQYAIVDEVHNAKNPASIRSLAVKDVVDSTEYLALLSGTPIPNTVVDMYMLLSLLEPDHFVLDSTNKRSILTGFNREFKKNPGFVRSVLHNHRMIRRTLDDVLKDENVPQLISHDLEVQLQGNHRDIYTQVYENDDVNPGIKLGQLLGAMVDPNLVKPKLLNGDLSSRLGTLESDVYSALDEVVENATKRGGKVLIFSDLKVGVTSKLKRRYSEYGAEVIDGDVTPNSSNGNLSKREKVRKKFQQDPNTKVLIATTVMDEGVDLTAATDIVHLTLPYTPAAFDQRNRRSQRLGEVKKESVNVYTIKPTVDGLPTLAEGIEVLLEEKRRIIDFILTNPTGLTKEDLYEIENGKNHESINLSPYFSSPHQFLSSHLGMLKAQGHEEIREHYKKYTRDAEHIAKVYAQYWRENYAGNTANLYGKIIKILEENGSLERKLDVASGPFSLSRTIGEPVINLDINDYMLFAGKILEEEGEVVKGNIALQGSYDNLPFEDASSDFLLCSLAMHMSSTNYNQKEMSEREQALREFNRVLKPGGYGLLTLPHSVIAERDFENFYSGLDQLGFEVLPFSGFYKGPKGSKFRVYLAGLRKVSDPCEESIDTDLLRWTMDEKVGKRKIRSRRNRKGVGLPEYKEVKKEKVDEFFHTRSRLSLEDAVRSVLR